MKITFYFVRHGETLFNMKGRVQGICDSPLTELGRRQADIAHDALRDVYFDHVFSSPLGRCLETAEHVLDGREIEPVIVDDLREVNFGKLEGTRFTSHPDEIRYCFEKHDFSSVDGESAEQVRDRVLSVFEGLVSQCADGDHVLITSHGYFEMYTAAVLLGVDVERYSKQREAEGRNAIPNGGIMEFTYEDGEWKKLTLPMEPENFKPHGEDKTVHFYYVRHGETQFNQWNRIQGWSDSPLTQNGVHQAQLARKVLADTDFAAIYASPLTRARETAEILARDRNQDIVLLKGLKEIYFGEYEAVVADGYMDEIRRRHAEGDDWSDVGGESSAEINARIEHTLDKIASAAKDGDNVLLVSHGTLYMNILRQLFGMQRADVETKMRSAGKQPNPNGGIFRFDYVNGRFVMVEMMLTPEDFHRRMRKAEKQS